MKCLLELLWTVKKSHIDQLLFLLFMYDVMCDFRMYFNYNFNYAKIQ